jgi:hypothetical protein
VFGELDTIVAVDGRRDWVSRAASDRGQSYPVVAIASFRGGTEVLDAVSVIEEEDGQWVVRGGTVDGWACDLAHWLTREERVEIGRLVRIALEQHDKPAARKLNGGRRRD